MTITNIRPGERIKVHSRGVTETQLANVVIDTANIAPDAVTASEIADNSIGTTHLASDIVTTAKIANGAVTGVKIGVATIAGGNIGLNTVDNANLVNMAQATLKGRATGAGTGAPTNLTAAQVREITLVDEVIVSSMLADNTLANGKLANMAAGTIKGRQTGTGDPEDLSASEVRQIVLTPDVITGTMLANNTVPGTKIALATIAGGNIALNTIDDANLLNMVQASIKGRASGGGTGSPQQLTPEQVRTIINVADGADVTNAASIASIFANVAEKAAPFVDADMFIIRDSAAAGALKRVSWLSIGSSIWEKLGVLIANGASKAIPVDGDALALFDSGSLTFTKKLTWANLKLIALTSPALHGILHFFDAAEVDQLAIDPRQHNMEFVVRHATGGEILFGWEHGRFVHPLQPLEKHGRNVAYAQGALSKSVTHLAYPIVGISAIVEYGQSKAAGAETWPPKSTVNIDSNKMLGSHWTSSDGASFVPYGSSVFNPLVAQVMGGGGTVLTGGQIAVLAPGSADAGEPPGIGATNLFKLLMNRRGRVGSDTTHLLNYYNAAAGGNSMDVLRKNHTIGAVEVYGRYLNFLTDFSTAAASAGLSRQVLAILWGQGESEMLQSSCSSTNREEFRALLQIIIDDMQADALATGGNSRVPGFFAFVPGDNYVQDTDGNEDADLFVNMAFLEHMWAGTKSFYLIGPHYPYTDKNSLHMDANGSRWAGLKAGLVMDRVINQGLGWEPLAPIETEYPGGTELWVHFNVPVPPLRTGNAYRDGVARFFDDRGFTVTDSNGSAVVITGVDVFPTMVRLHLASALTTSALVWYAEKGAHLGHGNIRDSEVADPLFVYEYGVGSGDYTSANISALVDIPYDMSNWLCPFCLPVNWSRF